MIRLEDKGRTYKRYRPSSEEKIILADKGMQWVLSSNVSAIGVKDDDLIIRFQNGSLYSYSKQAKKLPNILQSNSKGKWVWAHLRRKNVPYRRIGSMPFETDTLMSDSDMFEKIDREGIRVEEPQVLDQRDVIKMDNISKPIVKEPFNILKAVLTIAILDDITGLDIIPINIIK